MYIAASILIAILSHKNRPNVLQIYILEQAIVLYAY